VFLLAVPVMAMLLVIGPRLLPEFRDPGAGRLDLWSAGLSLTSVLCVIYGLKKIAEGGPGWLPFLSILAGLAAGFVFSRRQLTLPDPLIDLRLFRAPGFSASLVTYMISCFVAFGFYIFIAQYLQLVLGLTPLAAGFWTLPWSAGFIAGSVLAPAIARRFRLVTVMVAGLGVSAAGFGLLTQVGGATALPLIVAGSAVFSLGLSPVITLANDMIMSSAPPERAGAAAGISETTAELGGALGIAILGSIGTVVYRSAIAEAAPSPSGAALLETARDAFAQALRGTAAICAAMLVATAIAAGTLLRRLQSKSGP
jgi:DHA2 family multidrug resistance protein-like MFS transporter